MTCGSIPPRPQALLGSAARITGYGAPRSTVGPDGGLGGWSGARWYLTSPVCETRPSSSSPFTATTNSLSTISATNSSTGRAPNTVNASWRHRSWSSSTGLLSTRLPRRPAAGMATQTADVNQLLIGLDSTGELVSVPPPPAGSASPRSIPGVPGATSRTSWPSSRVVRGPSVETQQHAPRRRERLGWITQEVWPLLASDEYRRAMVGSLLVRVERHHIERASVHAGFRFVAPAAEPDRSLFVSFEVLHPL